MTKFSPEVHRRYYRIQSGDTLISKYSELVYNGFWFPPEREARRALITETQSDVTGLVRLKLCKGDIIVAGRRSPKSIYDPKIATMEATLRNLIRATRLDSSV